MTPLRIGFIIAILINILLHTVHLVTRKEKKLDSFNILIPWALLLLEIETK